MKIAKNLTVYFFKAALVILVAAALIEISLSMATPAINGLAATLGVETEYVQTVFNLAAVLGMLAALTKLIPAMVRGIARCFDS